MAEHAVPARKTTEPAAAAKARATAAPGGFGELLNRRGKAAMGGYAQLLARRASANATTAPIRAPGPRPVQLMPNRTGLPDRLKAGIEALSGLAMDDVRVHRNSPKPAGIGARAFARGSEIHLATGQERHLPHESWHVVQQKQGRVAATGRVNTTPLNDSAALEREADRMGARALSASARPSDPAPFGLTEAPDFRAVMQRVPGLAPGTVVMIHFGRPHYPPGYPARGMVLEDRGDTYLVHVHAHQAVFAEEDVEPVFSGPKAISTVREPAATDASVEEEPPQAEEAQKQLATAEEEASKSYDGLAAILLGLWVAFETLIDRVRGTETRRGNYASQQLMSQMGLMATQAQNLSGEVSRDVRSGLAVMEPGDSGRIQTDLQKQVSASANRNTPGTAFKYGLNPRPMPIAQEYAPLGEIGAMLLRASFLLTATREELTDYENRVNRFLNLGERRAQNANSPLVTIAADTRTRGVAGYVAGVFTSSSASSGLSAVAPVLGSNVLNVQIPWDTFHIANDMAVKARQYYEQANESERRLMRFKMRMLHKFAQGRIKALPKIAQGGIKTLPQLALKGVRSALRK